MTPYVIIHIPTEIYSKYKLSPKEGIIINWLIYFIDSGKQDFIDRPEGRYYWVAYSKVIQDLSKSLNINSISPIYKLFNSLCSKGILLKIDSSKNYHRRLYFRFGPNVKEELLYGVKDMKADPFGLVQEAKKVDTSIRSEVLDILSELDTLESAYETKLFTFKNPSNGGKVTKSLLKFNRQILDIYQGTFSRQKYIINDIFENRNKELIDLDNWKKIKECKGNWDKVKELVVEAATNYCLWFSPTREPLGKKWLTKDVSTWMYDSYYESSLFLACVVREPREINEKFSDDIVDDLPDNVYESAYKFKKEVFPDIKEFENNQFWFAINKVFKVENRLKSIYRENYMVSLWLESGKEGGWTCKYLEWLKTCWGDDTLSMLLVKHLGPNGRPWKKWLSSEEDLLDISEELYTLTLKE